jgi:hypothetical protein
MEMIIMASGIPFALEVQTFGVKSVIGFFQRFPVESVSPEFAEVDVQTRLGLGKVVSQEYSHQQLDFIFQPLCNSFDPLFKAEMLPVHRLDLPLWKYQQQVVRIMQEFPAVSQGGQDLPAVLPDRKTPAMIEIPVFFQLVFQHHEMEIS